MTNQAYELLSIIVDQGRATSIVNHLKPLGLKGATVLRGLGTVNSSLFKFFEVYEERKEIILSLVEKEKIGIILNELIKKYKIHLDNKGIAYTCEAFNYNKRTSEDSIEMESLEINNLIEKDKYEAIFVITSNGRGDQVVEAAHKAGARGATIVHGRGSGVHEQGHLFGFVIEPEKEIVLMLLEKDKVDGVIEKIEEEVELSKPGNGILFTFDVSKAVGLIK